MSNLKKNKNEGASRTVGLNKTQHMSVRSPGRKKTRKSRIWTFEIPGQPELDVSGLQKTVVINFVFVINDYKS